jgi:hypothetical protein
MFHWGDVAVENEQRARQSRDQLLRDHAAGRGDLPLGDELHPAMVTIAACAHALEALYAELAELVGPDTLAEWDKARRHGRWAEVAGILALAFAVDVADWRPRLKRLFELRNAAVHPKVRWESPQMHPALPVQVSSEYVLYSAESATQSVDLLVEILETCVGAPKEGPVEAWVHDAAGPVARLSSLRSERR